MAALSGVRSYRRRQISTGVSMFKWNHLLPRVLLKLQHIQYGKNLKLYGVPLILKDKMSQICLGDQVTINSGILSNLLGLYQRTHLVARHGGKITIGNHVGMSGVTIYAWKDISVGDYTQIGANTKIVDTDFHPLDPLARQNNDIKTVKTAPVYIGKNVFIGMNCIILKGSYIPDNCVVGGGSVVCGKFSTNSVIVGNPAREIRKNI